MPYIEVKTNTIISKQQGNQLKTSFGKAIELIPGKTERWLMLDFCDNQRMWLAGDDAPSAMLEVEIFGSTTDSAYDALTAELTSVVSDVLCVAPDRVYIKYEEIDHWGWNGANF